MKVVTPVVNNINFIYIQYYSLKKYMKCDYEFIIFNDAKDFPDKTNDGNVNIRQNIRNICNILNLKCIDIPNEHHKIYEKPSKRTADSCNFILKYQLENPDKYLLLDSDMFLINDFHMNDYEKYECAIVLQHKEFLTFDYDTKIQYKNGDVFYLWNGLYYFNIPKIKHKELINWDCVEIQNTLSDNYVTTFGVDTGGGTAEFLYMLCDQDMKNIPSTSDLRHKKNNYNTQRVYFIKHLWSLSWDDTEMPDFINGSLKKFIQNDPRNQNGKYYCEIYDNKFLHYRAGGNWNGEGLEFHNNLSNQLLNVFLN